MGNAPVSVPPPVVCERCEQQKQQAAERQDDLVGTACTTEYDLVKKCMKANDGNIADCRQEWDRFRRCYGKEKK